MFMFDSVMDEDFDMIYLLAPYVCSERVPLSLINCCLYVDAMTVLLYLVSHYEVDFTIGEAVRIVVRAFDAPKCLPTVLTMTDLSEQALNEIIARHGADIHPDAWSAMVDHATARKFKFLPLRVLPDGVDEVKDEYSSDETLYRY